MDFDDLLELADIQCSPLKLCKTFCCANDALDLPAIQIFFRKDLDVAHAELMLAVGLDQENAPDLLSGRDVQWLELKGNMDA